MMTERPFAAACIVLAAFAAGAVGTAAAELVADGLVRVLLAVSVAGLGVGALALSAGRPWTPPVLPGVGAGLVVFGAFLAGGASFGVSSPYLVILLAFGLPALAALATRVVAGFGVLAPIVVVLLMVTASAGQNAVSLTMLAVAVAGGAVMLAAPAVLAGAVPGDLAGATAGTAVAIAGLGASPLGALVDPRLLLRPPAAVVFGAVAVAAVLLMVAVARRDLAGGLLAASVFVLAPASVAHVVVPAVVAVVALVAVRVPAVRSALVGVPGALRADRPTDAAATAACAVVAATGLVLVVLALPDWPVTGFLVGFVLLVAGLLAYFLPGSHGAALSVVTLVALLLALRDAGPGVVVLAVVFLPLSHRHPRPPVFAATAFLLLGLDFGDATGWLVLLVGAVAAVLALWGPFVAVGQAVGTVALAMSAFGPAPTGWQAALTVLALVLVVSTARRPSAALAVAAAVTVFDGLRLVGPDPARLAVVTWCLVVAAVALVVAALAASRAVRV
jgi:hypothetical protein